MKPKTIFLLTILMVYALGIAAQSVLTTDAMIRVAEQKAQRERMAADGKYLSPAQKSALTLVVKVADEQAADTVPYVGEGYITGDDIISGSDWTSTTDVISVGAWCANTTQRTNAQGQQDTQSPGVNVVSAWNRYYDTANGGPTSYIDAMTWQGFPYGSTTGTSMACPAVAGIVALWLQAHPELTLADVKDVLANSCDNDEFTAKNPIRWGYGKVNAKRGLEYIQDHATGIVDITTMPPGGSQPPVWRGASGYTLDGRRLSGKPSQKGVYINKGIKVVMK